MSPTKILCEEHEIVKTLTRVLENICGRLKSGEKVEPQHVEDAIFVIKGFADRAHHMKEEDLLFPAMESAGLSKEEMLVEAITTEHDLGRGYVRGIGDALMHYSLGDTRAGLVLCENTGKYVKLIAEHMAKEEDVVFPLADKHLSEVAKRELTQAFEKIDEDVIGREQQEKFMRIVSTLEGIYLEEE